jgi:hypothetical protein
MKKNIIEECTVFSHIIKGIRNWSILDRIQNAIQNVVDIFEWSFCCTFSDSTNPHTWRGELQETAVLLTLPLSPIL